MTNLTADVRSAKIEGAPVTATPTYELLEEASEQLAAIGGALGVLAGHLERIEDIGTDTPLAAYAAGHAVTQVRKLIAVAIERMMANARGAH